MPEFTGLDSDAPRQGLAVVASEVKTGDRLLTRDPDGTARRLEFAD
jgi:hypothetical protein